jgi:hypothetical protein
MNAHPAGRCSDRSRAIAAYSAPTGTSDVRLANEQGTDAMTPSTFSRWRFVHLLSSGMLCLLALIHSALTPVLYRGWPPDAVWFLGTGLGLLLLGVSNVTHVGIEPCRQPTARLVRSANWVFLLFGIGAVLAVPEPQAYLVLAGLAGQAMAGLQTLPGPADMP